MLADYIKRHNVEQNQLQKEKPSNCSDGL